jgi:hypothetical protein
MPPYDNRLQDGGIMGYAVFHRDEAGEPTFEDVASLEAALELVERSRNGDGPEDVRVFREVPIEVRTYYKVQVADEVPAAADEVPAAADEVPAAAGEVPAAADEVAVAADEPSAEPVAVADEVAVAGVEDDPYDVRRLLEPAGVAEADRSVPVAPPPGAFPLAGPAVTQPTVEVHAANVDDEDGPAKRHSLFGRGG